MSDAEKPAKTLLAVASGGGHWEQLILVRDGFADFDIVYASTIPNIGAQIGITNLVVTDFNRNQPFRIITAFLEALRLVRSLRPAVIFSTGAAPGLIVLLAGKLCGVKTVWLDSVANAEQLSMSGKLALSFVDLHCVQWEHLAQADKSRFLGRVL